MELNGRESMVPKGAYCRTHAELGPGTPYFDDASPALRDALDLLDFGPNSDQERLLDIVLKESRVRDTLTLWHLLHRVAPAIRVRVYDRTVALVPLPPTVTREGILALDVEMLEKWIIKMDFEAWGL